MANPVQLPAVPHQVSVFRDTQRTLVELLTETVVQSALMVLGAVLAVYAMAMLLPKAISAVLLPVFSAAAAVALAFLFATQPKKEVVPFDQAFPNAPCGLINRERPGGEVLNLCFANSFLQLLLRDRKAVDWFLEAPRFNEAEWRDWLAVSLDDFNRDPVLPMPRALDRFFALPVEEREKIKKYLTVLHRQPRWEQLPCAMLMSDTGVTYQSYLEGNLRPNRIMEISAQLLRERLHAVRPAEIPLGREQADGASPFTIILELLPPEFSFQLEQKMFYKTDGMPAILDNPEGIRRVREENRGLITLPVLAAPHNHLADMFRGFSNEQVGAGNSVELPGVDGANHRYDLVRKEYKACRGPRSLRFQYSRFDNARNKNQAPIFSPELFELDTLEEGSVSFQLEGFVVHLGVSINGGHYISFTRGVDRTGRIFWYKNDDHVVTQITEAEWNAAKPNAYITHYQRI
jgi:hypothetical protein